MIKNHESRLKLGFKKALRMLATLFMSASIMTGCGGKEAKPVNPEQNHFLPPISKTIDELIGSDLDDEFKSEKDLYVLADNARLPSKVGSTTKINLCYNAPSWQQELIKKCLEEYNDIFAFINPAYKFELNTNPSSADLNCPYDIDLYEDEVGSLQSEQANQLKNEDALEEVPGKEILNYNIYLTKSTLSGTDKEFFRTFKHKFAHALGFGDADNWKKYTQNTIMTNINVEGGMTELSANDIKILYSLYRQPDTAYNKKELLDFISEHEGKYTFEAFAEKKIKSELEGDLVQKILERVASEDCTYTDETKEMIKTNLANGQINKTLTSVDVNLIPIEPDFSQKEIDYKHLKHYGEDLRISHYPTKVEENGLTSCDGKRSRISFITNNDGILTLERQNTHKILLPINNLVLSFDYPEHIADGVDPAKVEILAQTKYGYQEYFDKLVEYYSQLHSNQDTEQE